MPDYITAEPVTWAATLQWSQRYRCKTRKRFVKLLMAEGVSRNVTNRTARAVQEMGKNKIWSAVSYQSFYILSRLCGVLDEPEEEPNNV